MVAIKVRNEQCEYTQKAKHQKWFSLSVREKDLFYILKHLPHFLFSISVVKLCVSGRDNVAASPTELKTNGYLIIIKTSFTVLK